jgi:hypothetical protein
MQVILVDVGDDDDGDDDEEEEEEDVKVVGVKVEVGSNSFEIGESFESKTLSKSLGPDILKCHLQIHPKLPESAAA